LLWLVATSAAVATAIMANYNGLPSKTQLAWLISSALFTLAGGMAQIASGASSQDANLAGVSVSQALKKIA
jgi:hypothetical protein